MRRPTARPDAIVLACWPAVDALYGEIDASLIALAGKAVIQRVVECLVAAGCRHIAVVLGDLPGPLRALLGDGERWGCRIEYCVAAEGASPLAGLGCLAPMGAERCLLAPADVLIDAPPAVGESAAVCWADQGVIRWTGWACLTAAQIRDLVLTAPSRAALSQAMLGAANLGRQWVAQPADCSTAEGALDAATRALSRPHFIDRRPQTPGVWISHGARVHPTARLLAPVYIGQGATLAAGVTVGPNVTVGQGCCVDREARLTHSLLLPGTYIGAGLSVCDSVVAPARLINVRHATAIAIADADLLGEVGPPTPLAHTVPVSQRVLAAMLWLVTFPLGPRGPRSRLARLQPASGALIDFEVRFTPAHEAIYAGHPAAWREHFFRTFRPGLIDVIAGRVALVGLHPRTSPQLAALPEHTRRLYQAGLPGLLNESLLLGPAGDSPAMRHAGDALAIQPLPMRVVSGLLLRYARRVLGAPAPSAAAQTDF